MPRCNKVFTNYAKNLFPRLADTLVTLTPLLPLVTFQQKPCFPRDFDGEGQRVSLLGGNMKKTGLLVLLLATAAWAHGLGSNRALTPTVALASRQSDRGLAATPSA